MTFKGLCGIIKYNEKVVENMESETRIVSGGASTMGILGVAFVIMKIMEIITWSWWLVLLPFYGGLVLIILVMVLILIFSIFFSIFT